MTTPSSAPGDVAIKESALETMEQRILAELDGVLTGDPCATARVTDHLGEYVRALRERGTPIEQVVVQCKRILSRNARMERLRDSGRWETLGAPLITACITAYYAET